MIYDAIATLVELMSNCADIFRESAVFHQPLMSAYIVTIVDINEHHLDILLAHD